MSAGPQVRWLSDGRRLHLNHGPIDLIVEIWGTGRATAYEAAIARFDGVLPELVAELPALRRPAQAGRCFDGAIAQHMHLAAVRYLPEFVTPMAAVAGAVADDIAGVISGIPGVTRAFVNNGGDVALVLGTGQSMVADVGRGAARATLHAQDPIRGVATSGWQGRSFSFGIADAVTVLARTAAEADVAATLIANHVDIPDHPEIRRVAAENLQDDSDLGTRLVTVAVPPLSQSEITSALERGQRFADNLAAQHGVAGGLILLKGDKLEFGKVGVKPVSKQS